MFSSGKRSRPVEKCLESRRKVATTVAGRNEQEQGKEQWETKLEWKGSLKNNQMYKTHLLGHCSPLSAVQSGAKPAENWGSTRRSKLGKSSSSLTDLKRREWAKTKWVWWRVRNQSVWVWLEEKWKQWWREEGAAVKEKGKGREKKERKGNSIKDHVATFKVCFYFICWDHSLPRDCTKNHRN